MNDSHDSNG